MSMRKQPGGGGSSPKIVPPQYSHLILMAMVSMNSSLDGAMERYSFIRPDSSVKWSEFGY